MHKLTREQSEDLGFAITSFIKNAITKEELLHWCYYIIELYEAEDIPIFIFDLETEKYQINEIYRIIGFVPSTNLTLKQKKAVYGIAIKRVGTLGDVNYKEKTVLNALEESPEIIERFHKAFPFLPKII